MKVNINDYKGKYVMHCKTKEEAEDFCNYLHSIGKQWCNGNTYLNNTHFSFYEERTAYNFNFGNFCYVGWYEHEYKILEWSDFMNKEFTKADLRTGDVVLRRDGRVGIVNRDLDMLILQELWSDLKYLNDDLTSASGCNERTIMAVRRPRDKSDCQFEAFKYGRGTLIYERKEVEEMTLTEVCKALGKQIKIIPERTD